MEDEQWCSICSKMVSPMNEYENKCPLCDTQFGDAMENLRDQNINHSNNDSIDLRSAWVFSLYAPIFLGLMNALSPSLATISSTSRNDEENEQESGNNNELVIGRRRRTSTYMMNLFRGLHVRMISQNENIEQNRNFDIDNNNNINNNNILVIDASNEGALIVRGPNWSHTNRSNENNPNPNTNINSTTIGSLNDFVDGSGFDLLLQHLAQISPSGYASVNPPTKKEAIEEMENVMNDEKLQCTICLEDLEIGIVAKEMPCKHKFHSDCIVSWLKLHSSCPVCRFQMPCEDSNVLANLESGNREGFNNEVVRGRGIGERGRNGRRNWFPVLQSFNNFLPFP